MIAIMTLSSVSLTRADCKQDKEDCIELLTECKNLVAQKDEVIDSCIEAGGKLQDMYKDTKVKLDESQSELQKIYRNPFFMFAIGISAGFVIDRAVLR